MPIHILWAGRSDTYHWSYFVFGSSFNYSIKTAMNIFFKREFWRWSLNLKLESYKLVIHRLMTIFLVNNNKKRSISLKYICAETACISEFYSWHAYVWGSILLYTCQRGEQSSFLRTKKYIYIISILYFMCSRITFCRFCVYVCAQVCVCVCMSVYVCYSQGDICIVKQ